MIISTKTKALSTKIVLKGTLLVPIEEIEVVPEEQSTQSLQ